MTGAAVETSSRLSGDADADADADRQILSDAPPGAQRMGPRVSFPSPYSNGLLTLTAVMIRPLVCTDSPQPIIPTVKSQRQVEDSYSVTRAVDGIPYLLSLTDTAGQEEYRGLWETANMKSDAFLLVYDITNKASLTALNFFLDLIAIEAEQRLEDNQRLMKDLGSDARAQGLEVGLPPPVAIVAGNKCDLKEARVVGAREGLEFARKHGCGFMETSAREMVNVEETFACRCSILVGEREGC